MSPPLPSFDKSNLGSGTTIIRRTAVEHGFRRAAGGASETESLAVIREQRDHEKQELAKLNDRFAAYIQRVKFLESQNKQLQADLEDLRSNYSLDSERLRREFEPVLADMREKLDSVTTDKAKLEIRAKRAVYDAQTYRQLTDDVQQWITSDHSKIELLERTLRENEIELDCLHGQLRDLEQEKQRQKTELARLHDQLIDLLRELDAETVQRVQVENEKQTLEEQIPFLNAVHEQEMSELRSLQSGAHIDPSAFYRSELQRAIKEIRADFAQLSQAQRTELEEYYRIKTDEVRRQEQERIASVQQRPTSDVSVQQDVHQLRTTINQSKTELNQLQHECSQLTGVLSNLEGDLEEVRRTNMLAVDDRDREIAELRARLADMFSQYDEIVANKTSLEFEINTYRRLLEGEEAHVKKMSTEAFASTGYQQQQQQSSTAANNNSLLLNNGYKSSSSSTHKVHHHHQQTSATVAKPPPPVQTEMQAKTTYQRSAKGPVSIAECSPDGRVITLENTSKNKEIDLSGWKIYRKVDQNPEVIYRFPDGHILNNSRMLRIWAGSRPPRTSLSGGDLVNNAVESWGVGVCVSTRLVNDQGDEKATHLQRTVYASST